MVTGTTRPSSVHTWVMPTFSPTIDFVAIASVLSPARERSARAGPAERYSVVPPGSGPPGGRGLGRLRFADLGRPAAEGPQRTEGKHYGRQPWKRKGSSH